MIPNGRVAYIDIRDIARVAKIVLTEGNYTGAMYFLTGAEALTYQEVVERLSKGLGYEVKNAIISSDDFRKRLETAGLEDWRIKSIIAQEAVKAGFSLDVTEEVKRLTGQAPISLNNLQKTTNRNLDKMGNEQDMPSKQKLKMNTGSSYYRLFHNE